MERQSRHLEALFSDVFFERYQTQLIGGAAEPLYRPAKHEDEPHRLYYREDYFASALHEISHWCIAGEARRRQLDFGYWYNPDGRTMQQQRAFETVEIKPQALEWIFTMASGLVFTASADNLSAADSDARGPSTAFLQAVENQAIQFCQRGLPDRAGQFVSALVGFYDAGNVLDASRYQGGLTLA